MAPLLSRRLKHAAHRSMHQPGRAGYCLPFLPRLNNGHKMPECPILFKCHGYGPVYNNSRRAWSVIGLRLRQAIACPNLAEFECLRRTIIATPPIATRWMGHPSVIATGRWLH